MPDALVAPASQGPGEIAEARASLRLALIASLQHLPARQRAVLLQRDVLSFSAAETAQIVGTSVPAVKSALQRARARLEEVSPREDELSEPTEPQRRAILERYVDAVQNADIDSLRQLLEQDTVLEATPNRTWYAGLKTCLPFLSRHVFGAGRWRMAATSANGQPAMVAYVGDGTGPYQAYGVVVLTTTPRGISRINAFGDPRLAAVFGCPTVLP